MYRRNYFGWVKLYPYFKNYRIENQSGCYSHIIFRKIENPFGRDYRKSFWYQKYL